MPWKRIEITDEEVAEGERLWKGKARFLADESLGREAATFLRDQGWNCRFVDEVGLQGHSDEDVYAFAKRDDRILLTHDTDFMNDRSFPLHGHPGVIVLPGGSGEAEPLVRAMFNMLKIVGPYRLAYRESKVVFNADGTLVVRNREFATGAVTNTRYRLRTNAPTEIWEEE